MTSEAQDLAKDLVGRKTRIRELEQRVEELEEKLRVTQVALSNLLSGAEQIPSDYIFAYDHIAGVMWDPAIRQARKVLPDNLPSGSGKYGVLTKTEMDIFNRPTDQ